MLVSRALQRRNTRIRDEIMKMMAEKSPRGRQKYTSGYIFDRVAEKYNLMPRTVKNIFWDNGSYCDTALSAQNIASPA